MKFILTIFIFSLVAGCHSEPDQDASKKWAAIDFSNKPKTVFVTANSIQRLEITWVNDTLILAKLEAAKDGGSSKFESVLINRFPNSDPEIFEDEENNAHAVSSYTIEEKSQHIFVHIDIALDTAFAVIRDLQLASGDKDWRLNKMMGRAK